MFETYEKDGVIHAAIECKGFGKTKEEAIRNLVHCLDSISVGLRYQNLRCNKREFMASNSDPLGGVFLYFKTMKRMIDDSVLKLRSVKRDIAIENYDFYPVMVQGFFIFLLIVDLKNADGKEFVGCFEITYAPQNQEMFLWFYKVDYVKNEQYYFKTKRNHITSGNPEEITSFLCDQIERHIPIIVNSDAINPKEVFHIETLRENLYQMGVL